MSESIIVALITLAGTIITVILAHRSTIATLDKNSALADQELKGQLAVIDNKIETLSERVDKHSNVIDRTYRLEERMSVAEERLSDAHHRINELRDDAK